MLDTAFHDATILSFPDGDHSDFGSGLVHFQHRLAESGLFEDDRLAKLLDGYPGEYQLVTTTVGSESSPEWRNGTLEGVSGEVALEAVRSGRLWISLRRLDVVAPDYDALITQCFEEAENLNPGLKTFRRKSSILISSPSARVLYHSDIPMVALMHVRGRKRIWLYDAASQTHLPDEVLESVILRETEEEIPFEQSWDNEAKVFDLAPGDGLTWTQNAPHRVDNLEGLNVSVTTDFFTPAAQRKYGVYYTNGVLRRRLGLTPRSTRTDGAMALAKCALAAGLKKAGFQKSQEREMMKSFILDPDQPGQLIHLERSEWTPITQL